MRPVQGPGVSWWPVRAVLTPVMQVAGLGNYGLRGTRHSVGMEVLDQLARQLAVAEGWRVDKRCCADVALATAHGLELVLLKPRRFMNLNGLSVASAAELYSLGPGDIYLVHDDLDKALGKVAIKLGGSARGHNGVQSCISALQSNCWGAREAGADPGPGSDLSAGAHPEPSACRARGQGLTQTPRDPCG
ncbi:probable peptidyl-tRNA hydrolase isoform X4 [Motacilla alba alba]|uniref:probable peptidyl-tRNA hydrolase isoform X4 n=1 Tax=Motacilla alba alba TaxID=1094192 RepID=UPI0018D511AA|nr:probable peptidyl-tRNA hydrolase isoform X4 [Motacilla alba alba]